MSTQDTCCTIVPYFLVKEGQLSAFKSLCEEFVEATDKESGCLFYGFSFKGNHAHCREGYQDANGVLAHLENVGEILQRALQIADIEKLEIHGPEKEVAKLREPLAYLSPDFFVLEYGFRR